MIIGHENDLVHVYAGMTLDFSYFGRKIPLSNFSCRKQTVTPMCLTLGVTILASTTDIKIALYYQCTVGAPVWSDKTSMYLWTTLVFLTYLSMHLISPPVESDYIAG